MAEVEDRDNSHHHHQTTMNNLPRDLLKRFLASNHRHHHRLPLPAVKPDHHADAEEEEEEEEEEDEEGKGGEEEEELELSLGLSMNGRFGVDPSAKKKIKRTTSIPEFANPVRDEEMGGYVVPVNCAPLIRTCSLPTETEEEWRKRKELQTLRRMEARRKRNEKQRNLKAMRERSNRGLSSEEFVGSEEGGGGNNLVVQGAGGLRRTTSLTTRVGGLGLNGDNNSNSTKEKEKEKEKGSSVLLQLPLPPPSPPQGSIASSSESDCQQGQGTTPMDTRSPIGTNLLPDEHKSPVTRGGAKAVTENSGKRAVVTRRSLPPQNKTKDIVRNLLEEMPSVSTKGEGPNGKRIEGFLYRYGKGEDVRILCVCHGNFLTPAEFVKHAGGTDVANPLKHIVVSPSFL